MKKGGWELGCRIDGCHAEYVRVPYADMGLTKLPEDVSLKMHCLSEIFYPAAGGVQKLCEIKSEDVVVIIGAGPVGLCSMMSAKVQGASKIVALDVDDTRLEVARKQNLADYFVILKKMICTKLL